MQNQEAALSVIKQNIYRVDMHKSITSKKGMGKRKVRQHSGKTHRTQHEFSVKESKGILTMARVLALAGRKCHPTCARQIDIRKRRNQGHFFRMNPVSAREKLFLQWRRYTVKLFLIFLSSLRPLTQETRCVEIV